MFGLIKNFFASDKPIWVKALGVGCMVVIIIYCYNTARSAGDFTVFLEAGQKLRNHDNVYTGPFHDGARYLYSPFFALVLAPFTYLPFYITEFFWLLFTISLLPRIWKLFTSYLDLSGFSTKQKNAFCLISFVLMIRFIEYNLGMIQINIFLFWLGFEVLNFIKQDKKITAGLLLAIAINIKLLLLPLVPYLLYRKEIKTVIVTIVGFIALLYLPALFIGFAYNDFLLSLWWSVLSPADGRYAVEAEIGPHSLTALLPVYLTNTVGEIDMKRNLINLTHSQVDVIVNCARGVLVLLFLLFLRFPPFIKQKNNLCSFYELAYLFLIIPLIFPHQQKYAFFFIFPATTYIVYFLFRNHINSFIYLPKSRQRRSIGVFSFLLLIICLTGRGVIGNYLNDMAQHYRILTMAVLLLIPLLVYLNPKKILEREN
jgi:hypothetical protein